MIKLYNISMGISIDGPEALNDMNRITRSGKGSFSRTMAGIAYLQNHGIPFHTISVLTSEALDQAPNLFKFFSELGGETVCFNVEETEGINSGQFKDVHIEKYKLFLKEFVKLNEKSGFSFRCREVETAKGALFGWNPELPDDVIKGQEVYPFKIVTVGSRGEFATFSPELLGQETDQWGKFILGNVLHESFEEVAHSVRFHEIWASIEAGIKQCNQSCPYFGVCGGGSPSNKLYENGTFASTETMSCKLHTQTSFDVILEHLEDKIANIKACA